MKQHGDDWANVLLKEAELIRNNLVRASRNGMVVRRETPNTKRHAPTPKRLHQSKMLGSGK